MCGLVQDGVIVSPVDAKRREEALHYREALVDGWLRTGDLGYLVDKIVNLRVFPDDSGKMNRSLLETGGGVLVVSQFTLYGDARGSRRPSYTDAAPPETARPLYERCLELFRERGLAVASGEFGAMMDVAAVNEGPVTILLDSGKLF